MSGERARVAEELLRRFAAALRAAQLYSRGHPLIARNIESLDATINLLHAHAASIVVGIVGDDIIVDDTPVSTSAGFGAIVGRLKRVGIERVTFDRGVSGAELVEFLYAVSTAEPAIDGSAAALPTLPHIRVGRVTVDQSADDGKGDINRFKRLYDEAISVARTLWESARTEAHPDLGLARRMVDDLAQAMAQNRTALIALTTLKNHDDYTFTHMVNVSILAMGQARALGIDGQLLAEIGLGALMHDIGKVRTPIEILGKPDKLTDAEFALMARHTVDGAEMLRTTPDMPTLAPVVALEHHLRLDGSGYPAGLTRQPLNVATLLCSIADVYDAMRRQRQYQKAFPTERILEVLRRNDGLHFDQHLVRRFVQLIGIYPPGSLVRLDTGDVGVVVKAYAPDPLKPRVRVIMDEALGQLDFPYHVNLWETPATDRQPSAILGPLDAAQLGVDPLALMTHP